MHIKNKLSVLQESNNSFPRKLNVIVKVTNRCQYKCSYCFVRDSVRPLQMSAEILGSTIRKLFSQTRYSEVHFIWHGGEPLLRGIKFFQEIVDLQNKYCSGLEYSNSVQTNGGLLDNEFVQFFKKNGFSVGISLDGDQELNDIARLDSLNQSTYYATIEALHRLRVAGFPIGAIATIHKGNVFAADRIYSEFKTRNLHLKLDQLVLSGRAKSSQENLRVTPLEYELFLNSILTLWFRASDQTIKIEPLESMFRSIVNPHAERRGCVWSDRCHRSFIAVSPNGDLYPCGLFQGYPEYRYGNIGEITIDDIMSTKIWETLELRHKVIAGKCDSCIFYERCFGGCPFSALVNNGDIMSKDYYCESFKMVFAKMVELLCHSAENLI